MELFIVTSYEGNGKWSVWGVWDTEAEALAERDAIIAQYELQPDQVHVSERDLNNKWF